MSLFVVLDLHQFVGVEPHLGDLGVILAEVGVALGGSVHQRYAGLSLLTKISVVALFLNDVGEFISLAHYV